MIPLLKSAFSDRIKRDKEDKKQYAQSKEFFQIECVCKLMLVFQNKTNCGEIGSTAGDDRIQRLSFTERYEVSKVCDIVRVYEIWSVGFRFSLNHRLETSPDVTDGESTCSRHSRISGPNDADSDAISSAAEE